MGWVVFILVIIAFLLIINDKKYKNSQVITDTWNKDTDETVAENLVIGIIFRKRTCWKCKKSTPVIALRFFKSIDQVSIANKPMVIAELRELPQSIARIINDNFPFFKKKYSKSVGYAYYANCCESCGALQGNFHLYEEPDGPFFNAHKLKSSYFIIDKNGSLELIKEKMGVKL